jgi:hypothetical protein
MGQPELLNACVVMMQEQDKRDEGNIGSDVSWSEMNQVPNALHFHFDAAGYQPWKQYGVMNAASPMSSVKVDRSHRFDVILRSCMIRRAPHVKFVRSASDEYYVHTVCTTS